MVNGITFSEQLITSANFAHFMYTFLNHANGVTKGCEVSQANGKIYVQKGYFIEYGRMVQVVGVEEIETPEVMSGQLYCKVVFEIDLSKTNTATEFMQGVFKTLTDANGYPDLTQEDLDNEGNVYQMPWCQYIKKIDGISEFRDLREILNIDSIWDAVSGQNQAYKGEFDAYFGNQKKQIEDMIAELKAEGYVLLSQERGVKLVQLPVSGWSANAPYTQSVKADGVLAVDTPVMKEHIPAGATAEQEKAIRKAAACVSFIDTADGSITVTCISKKPATDFQISIKGV